MSVYGAVIVSVALTPIGFFLEDIPDAQYAIMGIMMWASITIILILVFVTKVIVTIRQLWQVPVYKMNIWQMYKVYRDPEGKSVMATQQNNYTFQCSEETYKEQIEKLRKENIYLKNKVSICSLSKYV